MSQPGIEPRLQTGEAAFGPLWEAVRDRRPVRFGFLAAGRSTAQQRQLEPWGVVNRRGRWYVVGLDGDRGEQRVFRLSRIDGAVSFIGPPGSVTVPPGTDGPRRGPGPWDTGAPQQRTCLLRIRAGAGHGLRRHQLATRPDPDEPGWDPGPEVSYTDSQASVERAHRVVRRRRRRDRTGRPSAAGAAVIGRLKGALA